MPKYPWRELKIGGSFFVPFTREERAFSKVATRRWRVLYHLGYDQRAWGHWFHISREQDGLLITRVEKGKLFR